MPETQSDEKIWEISLDWEKYIWWEIDKHQVYSVIVHFIISDMIKWHFDINFSIGWSWINSGLIE